MYEQNYEKFNLYGYRKEDGGRVMNLVRGVLAYDVDPGKTVLLIFDQSFYDPTLSSSLLNPNQIRNHGITVNDTPLRYDPSSTHSIRIPDKFDIHLKSRGYVSYFPVRKPTIEELETCEYVEMTSNL